MTRKRKNKLKNRSGIYCPYHRVHGKIGQDIDEAMDHILECRQKFMDENPFTNDVVVCRYDEEHYYVCIEEDIHMALYHAEQAGVKPLYRQAQQIPLDTWFYAKGAYVPNECGEIYQSDDKPSDDESDENTKSRYPKKTKTKPKMNVNVIQCGKGGCRIPLYEEEFPRNMDDLEPGFCHHYYQDRGINRTRLLDVYKHHSDDSGDEYFQSHRRLKSRVAEKRSLRIEKRDWQTNCLRRTRKSVLDTLNGYGPTDCYCSDCEGFSDTEIVFETMDKMVAKVELDLESLYPIPHRVPLPIDESSVSFRSDEIIRAIRRIRY